MQNKPKPERLHWPAAPRWGQRDAEVGKLIKEFLAQRPRPSARRFSFRFH